MIGVFLGRGSKHLNGDTREEGWGRERAFNGGHQSSTSKLMPADRRSKLLRFASRRIFRSRVGGLVKGLLVVGWVAPECHPISYPC